MNNYRQQGFSATLADQYILIHIATWSIIVLDSVTKTIGVAGASCTFNVYGIAKVITASAPADVFQLGFRI